MKVPSLLSVYADGFCSTKFLERRRALRQNKEESSRRTKEMEEMKVGRLRKKIPFRKRLVYVKKNPKNSLWWEYVMGGSYADPTSRDGKAFRARFRTTHSFFLDLVEKAKELFPKHKKKDAIGKSSSPIELKVLAVLKILGRGVCFDDCADCTFMNKETHRRFFHKFCHLFAKKFYSVYVYGPRNDTEMKESMSEYSKAGFEGCFGSTDGVHVSWDRCHSQQKQLHTGKEKYPTVAWNVTVNHKRWIMSVTKGFYGSYNDKTIVKYDNFLTSIHNKELYEDVKFNLRKRDGTILNLKGAWVLCDGGYHRWRCMQCPVKDGSSVEERRWSKWAESMRKDSECCFGILKGRWRILKTGIKLQSRDIIDDVFFTCCILHNMLMESDKINLDWTGGAKYLGAEGHHEDDDMRRIFGRLHSDATTDLSGRGFGRNVLIARQLQEAGDEQDEIGEEFEPGHAELNVALVEHFDVLVQNDEVVWPRFK